MRKILAILLVALLCSWVNLSYAQQEGLRLGFINLKKVLDDYEKVKDGEAALVKEAEEKNKEKDKMTQEIRSLREKID